MLNEQLSYIRNREITQKGDLYIAQHQAVAEIAAAEYLQWLCSLVIGEPVYIRRESLRFIELIDAEVVRNSATEVEVIVKEDVRLPDCRFVAGESIVISKNADDLVLGLRRLVPVKRPNAWRVGLNDTLTAVV